MWMFILFGKISLPQEWVKMVKALWGKKGVLPGPEELQAAVSRSVSCNNSADHCCQGIPLVLTTLVPLQKYIRWGAHRGIKESRIYQVRWRQKRGCRWRPSRPPPRCLKFHTCTLCVESGRRRLQAAPWLDEFGFLSKDWSADIVWEEVGDMTGGQPGQEDVTFGLIRQLCLLDLIQCSRDKRGALADCAGQLQLLTPLCVLSMQSTHMHTHTRTQTRPLVSKASLNIEKVARCHNLSFVCWYQCPILIHPWVYWLLLPVLSNLSQLLWLWLVPKLQPAPRLLRVILHGTGETETSAEP